MVNPPKSGDKSFPLYDEQKQNIHHALYEKAELLLADFREMEDISCNRPMGAMYLFPKLNFTVRFYEKFFDHAARLNISPDELY